MTEHIGHVEDRIARYGGFAQEVRGLCEAAGVSSGDGEPKMRDDVKNGILRIVGDLERSTARFQLVRKTPEAAAGLARQVVELIGKDGAYVACRRLGDDLRAIGDVQDRTLAACRMAVRRLKQHCLAVVADNSEAARLARRVLERGDAVLWAKEE